VVVLTGSNFTGATQVAFNGTVAPIFTVNSGTQITVTVPAGVTTGPITVTGPGGVGTSTTNFVVPPINDLCANAIAISCGQTVTGTTVGATATGDPTATCTTTITTGGVFYSIVGTGGNITVSTCSPVSTFDTKLYVFTGSCGAYTCVAGNDDNNACTGNTLTSQVTFPSVLGTTYLVFVSGFQTASGPFGLSATCAAVPPALTSLSPVTGPEGTPVTITGTGFTGASRVAFNGITAAYTVVNATTITTTVPVGATTGNVVVTNNAMNSNGLLFTMTMPSATATAHATQFSVWPNPASAKAGLHVTLAAAAPAATITLHNVLGQVVATHAFIGTATEMSTAGLAAGTYLLTVQVKGQVPNVKRVVLE
jgi:hypothetical protein